MTIEPCSFPPGSSQKLEVLRQRAELEQPLFIVGDATGPAWNCSGNPTPVSSQASVITEALEALTATLEARRTQKCD